MSMLLKVRLSYYFYFFLMVYVGIVFTVPSATFDGPALTLFSVNSFLYGFYIAPILAGQKARIDELQKAIRAEANALFALILKTKKLHAEQRNELQELFEAYIRKALKDRKPAGGEKEYEAIISRLLAYKGDDEAVVEKLLDGTVTNQQNRSTLSMQLRNKVYSNEWWVMLVLFSITLSFIVFINVGTSWQMRLVKALLCTGLTMLLVILVKLSTLTHKKAKELWTPYEKLISTHFYRID